jgi:hypothetical protein
MKHETPSLFRPRPRRRPRPRKVGAERVTECDPGRAGMFRYEFESGS